jgi:hypothetical protein
MRYRVPGDEAGLLVALRHLQSAGCAAGLTRCLHSGSHHRGCLPKTDSGGIVPRPLIPRHLRDVLISRRECVAERRGQSA